MTPDNLTDAAIEARMEQLGVDAGRIAGELGSLLNVHGYAPTVANNMGLLVLTARAFVTADEPMPAEVFAILARDIYETALKQRAGIIQSCEQATKGPNDAT